MLDLSKMVQFLYDAINHHHSGDDNLTDSDMDSRVLSINQWYI